MRIFGRRPSSPVIRERYIDWERAGDPSTPPADLEELSHHADPMVRFQVANNPFADSCTLEHLHNDEVVERIQRLYGNGRVARAVREGTWPWSLPGDLDGFGNPV